MEQMLVWAFIHREFARQFRERPRCDDAFYSAVPQQNRAWRLLDAFWPRRERRN